ncbi:general amidase [Rhizoctonia solani AG-1 IA]|uniref:amidase n=1 Tax=Thanatephorus cucumeris (strain AG1-IA) TaxID=983506 RepID=L8WJF9_THACA|nr:general amidase [Rhizoctonia solani AG-1 IA]
MDPKSSTEQITLPAQATEDWKTRAEKKRENRFGSIPLDWRISIPEDRFHVLEVPYECGLLDPLEVEITDTLDVQHILKKLESGTWSSVQVTRAFYKRAIVAHQTTNCLTEIFVQRALARAEEMDRYLKEHGKPKGPLHGLPISLKDQFTMKGLETINGYVANIGEFATEDCVLVEILYELGAVPFTRTNVPQTLMWGETYNNVFGRTLNPYDLRLTSGGSSGGEGALIAMHGSPLGVGTDIGGSIRIPSAMCGLYGLRPSYCRFPYYGAKNTMEGQESVMSVLGPMSNSLSGLKIFSKAIIDSRPWLRDPLCIRKAWDQEAYELVEHGGPGAKKCFAMLYDDGLVKPHPPLFRAMEMMKNALLAAGHEVIEWENKRHEDIFYNVVSSLYRADIRYETTELQEKQIFLADGDEDFKHECAKSGEPRIQTMDPELYSHELHNPETNKGVHIIEPLSVWQLWQLHKEKRELRKEYLDHWQATVSRTTTGRPVDAVISPAVPYAATSPFYTSLWNGVDYTVGIMPVTFVDPAVDKPVPAHDFYSDEDREIYHMCKDICAWGFEVLTEYVLDDPEVFKGAPIGLQVVGQRLEEEAVLGEKCSQET